jgi:hypothetical protein
MDMAASIEPKSDQMNAEDLLSGPRTFTITDVRPGPGPDQPVWVYFAEFPQGRPFKPSKTVRRIMVVAWGLDTAVYIGKRMTLFRDPDVRFGGADVGGIRVSHMSGIERPLKIQLAVTKGRRAPFVVEPLPAAPRPVTEAPYAVVIRAWAGQGITRNQLEDWTGEDAAEWSPGTFERLQGLWRALARGETTLAEAFPSANGVTDPPEPSDLDLEPSDAERQQAQQ